MKSKTFQAALFTGHLVYALAFTFLVFPLLTGGTSGLDPDSYGAAGRRIYETGTFPFLDRAPGYPLFIAGVAALTGGYRIGALQIAQCLVSAAACLLYYRIFRRTLQDETRARMAAVASALFPMMVWYVPRLWTETLLMLALAAWTLALLRAIEQPTPARAAVLGLATGAAALVKGIALVFLPLGVLVLVVCGGRQAWRAAAVTAVLAAAVIGPWTYRNFRLSGEFIPVHINLGLNAFIGNRFAENFTRAPLSYEALYAQARRAVDEVLAPEGFEPQSPAQDRQLLAAARGDSLALWLRKVFVQSLTFWYLAGDPAKSLLTGALQLPLLAAAVWGTLRRRERGVWLLWVPVVGIYAVGVGVFAFARLSAPALPYLIGITAAGLPQRAGIKKNG